MKRSTVNRIYMCVFRDAGLRLTLIALAALAIRFQMLESSRMHDCPSTIHQINHIVFHLVEIGALTWFSMNDITVNLLYYYSCCKQVRIAVGRFEETPPNK